jgi:hypothetical protein
MEDGSLQEVRLHLAADASRRIDLILGHETIGIPLEDSAIADVFAAREVRIETPSCNCILEPVGDAVAFHFECATKVRFTLAVNHLRALIDSLGNHHT